MPTPVILSAARTPMGRLQGSLSSFTAPQLGAMAVQAAVDRAGVRPEQVGEVILGNVLAAGVGQAPARQAALAAGLPESVAALTINKVCGSGLKAVMLAAQAIRAGDAEVIVAGGMESMSRAPWLLPRETPKLGDRTLIDAMLHDGLTCAFSQQSMGQIAETLAARDGIARAMQDQYSAESHRRALAAQAEGAFDREMIPVAVRSRGSETIISRDEGPRAESTVQKLASLAPAFAKSGTVTAGNASMISDGAAAVVVASEAFAEAHRLRPLARLLASATSGSAPEDLFIAPVAALEQAVSKSGLKLDDIGLYEINEAFAVQMLACMSRLQLAAERVNVHGGAIALGHPIGASGARVLTTLLYALERRQQRYGAAALCLGGGNAVALVVERV
jgi:acetyl-CoA C-acetyltransferase